jgi:isopentenyldiphosphate isomerase
MEVQRRGARASELAGPGEAERAGGTASAAGLGVESGGELLAICDARGGDLGAGLPRRLVHQEGVWHRSFHCWLVRAGPRGAELLLQRRAPSKDTWPGAWDVSAAGHYRPGEWLEGGLREIAEELGITLTASALVWLERHREVLRYASGLWDREYQDVYLARCELPLRAFAPDPAEVTGLVALPAPTVAALARGVAGSVRAPGRLWEGGDWRERPVAIRRWQLVTRTGGYYERVARAAVRLVRGARSRPGCSPSARAVGSQTVDPSREQHL